MRIIYCIIIIIIMTFNLSFCQKESYNWYFGEGAGITFKPNGTSPKALTDGQIITKEGVASISDKNGNLLFYTDGIRVWNKAHSVMQNGDDLDGSVSSTQSGVIVPYPLNDNLYYIFTVDWAEGTNGFRYSIVDISQNNGLGAITNKNILIDGNSCEKITAVKHANHQDIWVIIHEFNCNQFLSVLVTNNGITKSITSTAGVSIDGLPNNKIGYMKMSPNGKKIALANYETGVIQVLNFNNSTGYVLASGAITLNNNYINCYGVEFSTDGTKLYVSYGDEYVALVQFDLSLDNQDLIVKNAVSIPVGLPGSAGALQLGPDNKIYLTAGGVSYLGIINYPNKKGLDCDFVADGVYLSGRTGESGLPTFIQSYFKEFSPDAYSNSPICEGDSIKLYCSSFTGASYSWKGPNSFYSTLQSPVINNASLNMSGNYTIDITDLDGYIYSDTIAITINPSPNVTIKTSGSTTLCQRDSLNLYAKSSCSTCSYLWSTGSKEDNIYVNSAGKYLVTVTNSSGCSAIDSIVIEMAPVLNIAIESDSRIICNNNSLELRAKSDIDNCKYHWSTGESTSNISIKTPGTYTVVITSPNGCSEYAGIIITASNSIPVEILCSNNQCVNDSAYLTTNTKYDEYKWYFNGNLISSKDSVIIYKFGDYKVEVTDSNGCNGSSTITINQSPDVHIIGNNIICTNDSTMLSTNNKYIDYKWYCNGIYISGNENIIIRNPGKYYIEVVDSNGCSGSATLAVDTSNIKINGLTDFNFGTVCSGDTSTLPMIFKNTNNINLSISNLYLDNQNNFTIINNINYPAILKPNDSLEIDIKFSASSFGSYSTLMHVDINEPCVTSYSLKVTGSLEPKTMFTAQSLKAVPGNNGTISILGRLIDDKITSYNFSFNAEVTLPVDVFYPLNDLGTVQNNDRTISLHFNNLELTNVDKEIAKINGLFLLSNNEFNEIKINKITPQKVDFCWDSISGNLQIVGVCGYDLMKLQLLTYTSFSLYSNYKSSDVQMKINTQESGEFEISIYNLYGEKINNYSINKSNENLEDLYLNINFERIAQGTYFVVLKTQWSLISKPFIYIK